MKISDEGTCVQAGDCMPTRHDNMFRNTRRFELQMKYIDKHNCFLSGGRLYVKLKDMVVDAITGTLYSLSGHCRQSETGLFVDMNDINQDRETIVKFIKGKY